MSIHYLKIWPEYYDAIESGIKTSESRRNDRNFQVGDLLYLTEYNPKTSEFTGREKTFQITYVLQGEEFGVLNGWANLSLKPVELKMIKEGEFRVDADVKVLPKNHLNSINDLEKKIDKDDLLLLTTENLNKQSDIEVGDVVQVKSGGPFMTVETVDNVLVDCLWFHPTKQEVETASFPIEVLIKK